MGCTRSNASRKQRRSCGPPLRRPRNGARLPRPLHPPRGDLQPPHPGGGRGLRAMRTTRLPADEFLCRFGLHVLPDRLPHPRPGRDPRPDPILRRCAPRPAAGRPGDGSRRAARSPSARGSVWHLAQNSGRTARKEGARGIDVACGCELHTCGGGTPAPPGPCLPPSIPERPPSASEPNSIKEPTPASSTIAEAASFNRLYPECRSSLPSA
jgi:hypothetical protein